MFEKLRAKARYGFDNLMSKGTVSLITVLFLATAAVIVVAALIAIIFSNTTFGQNVWAGIMHTIDAGTITGTDTGDVPFLVIMSIVTLCGLFITSILIGIITTGFEEKLNSLKKGNSQVVEKNHTIILGFDENIYTIISELILANESSKDECIVVLSTEAKEDMEEAIRGQIEDFKTTRVVCRTGDISDVNMLKKCALSECRSVIVNVHDDFIVIKAILAINNYFSEVAKTSNIPCIVATVNDNTNYDAGVIAGEGNVEIMLTDDTISRIIAQTCRQSGLSEVMTELFDFDGDELYFEDVPELVGASFRDISKKFEKAVVFGIKRDGKVMLNPDAGTIMQAGDKLILLIADNGEMQVVEPPKINIEGVVKDIDSIAANKPDNILIIGVNNMLYRILKELDEYSASGTTVIVADETASSFSVEEREFNNITLKTEDCDTRKREELDRLVSGGVMNIVLISGDECDTELSDAEMLLKLIHLRDICEKRDLSFNITSEMKNPSNQKLARVAKVNDFVVGNYIVNMMMAQISENRDLAVVFRELLSADGNEIYINPITNYIDIEKTVNFYDITEIACMRGEVAVGYKRTTKDGFDIIVNPKKSDNITFNKNDALITLCN